MSIIIKVPQHIVYEDQDILVINKPASLMVEPDRNGHPNLLQQIKKYYKNLYPKKKDFYIQHVHRLDRPVSGIVLFAKKKSVLKNLSEQFAQRKVKKKYQALTNNKPLETKGTLAHWHVKDKKNKKAMIFDSQEENATPVKLTYTTENSEGNFLWTIDLHTGKFHQIRAQLAHVNCPIIGDSHYSSTTPFKDNQIMLHAFELEITHPSTDEKITFNSKAPFINK